MTRIQTILLAFPTVIFFAFLDWAGYGPRLVFQTDEFCVVDFLIGYFVCAVNNWLFNWNKKRNDLYLPEND